MYSESQKKLDALRLQQDLQNSISKKCNHRKVYGEVVRIINGKKQISWKCAFCEAEGLDLL